MLVKRIIPCLDVCGGRVVKGVNFENLRDAGDPVELAGLYSDMGADEIAFLDITATNDGRRTVIDIVEKTARRVLVPFTVGGGIRSVDDFKEILSAGANKISVNSAAVRDKSLIRDAASRFGSQCVVLAIDAKRGADGSFRVVLNGGRIETELDVIAWAREAEALGAGEIMLNSIDADGTKNGYDIEMNKAVADAVRIPVIASGGCGKLSDFYDVFKNGGADAALAASVFHYGEVTVPRVKEYLASKGIPVRL